MESRRRKAPSQCGCSRTAVPDLQGQRDPRHGFLSGRKRFGHTQLLSKQALPVGKSNPPKTRQVPACSCCTSLCPGSCSHPEPAGATAAGHSPGSG